MEKKIKPMIYQADRKLELLHFDKYKGYNYYILNLGTHPTAYVEIPEGHILHGMSYNEIYEEGYDIDVHGGLTYSNSYLMGIETVNWFIGWDYAHAGDYIGFYRDYFNSQLLEPEKKWTTEEIIKECEYAIDQIIEIQKKNDILEELKSFQEVE